MRIAENLIEVKEPSVKAYAYEKGCLDHDEDLIADDIISKLTIVFEPSQVKPLLEPKEGDWYFDCTKKSNIYPSLFRYDSPMNDKDDIHIPLNPFTLQAEKDGILREMVELCEVVR